jgi:hypothetical protein
VDRRWLPGRHDDRLQLQDDGEGLAGTTAGDAGVRAGVWRAKLTDAGRYYLDHGYYPPGLWREPPSRDRRAAGPALTRFTPARPQALDRPSGPPEPSGSAARVQAIDELAANLVARVVAAMVLMVVDRLCRQAGDLAAQLLGLRLGPP